MVLSGDVKQEEIYASQKEYVQRIRESLSVKSEEDSQEIEFLLKRL